MHIRQVFFTIPGLSDNIVCVRAAAEGGGREGPPGPIGAAGALAAAVPKAISAKGRRPVAANTLLYEERRLILLQRINAIIRCINIG